MAKDNKIISADDFASDVPVESTAEIQQQFTPPNVEQPTEQGFVNTNVPNSQTEEPKEATNQEFTPPNAEQPAFGPVANNIVADNNSVEPKAEETQRVKRTGSETEIREVDPTKNAKLQKRMKSKPKNMSVGKFTIPKKLVYIAVPVAIVVVFLIIAAIKGAVGGGSSSDNNFFTILDKIVQTEAGQFTYIIDVRTSEVKPVETKQEESNYEDVSTTELRSNS